MTAVSQLCPAVISCRMSKLTIRPASRLTRTHAEHHAEKKITQLGIEEQYMTVAEHEKLTKRLDIALFFAQQMLDSCRHSKESWELTRMVEAQRITDAAFTQICGQIAPGMTEKQLYAKLIAALYENGADGLAFDPIVVSGPNTSMPHGVAGSRVLQDGDFVTMDFGVLYQGYCSDMTRTVALGHATEEMRKVYGTVLRAQLAGIAASHAGASGKSVDGAARDIITEATAMATASVSRSTKRRIAPRSTRTRSLPALCAPQSRASTFRANSASASRMS